LLPSSSSSSSELLDELLLLLDELPFDLHGCDSRSLISAHVSHNNLSTSIALSLYSLRRSAHLCVFDVSLTLMCD